MQGGFFRVVGRARVLELAAGFAPVAGAERVGLEECVGRVAAEDVRGPEALPLAARSSMDGFAVRAADTFGAAEAEPQYLECAGAVGVSGFPAFSLTPGRCARIPTGGCLPAGADAVVMVEHTGELVRGIAGTGGPAGTIEVRRAVAPGENVMERGEDLAEGALAVPAGRRLRVADAGLLAALGRESVLAAARPRVAVLSTGDELTPRGAPPEPGRVRDVNSLTVALLARRAGAEPVSFGIVRDDREALAETLDAAWRECDAVLLSGGSSVGARDLAVRALEGFADAEILVHGVSMSPGKPAILARRGDRPVLGLPGQVGAALVVMRVLGVPLLRHLGGEAGALEHGARPELRAVLARNAAARQGREEFVRVRLEARPGGLPLAHPLPGPSGLLRTLVAADGLAVIPAGDEGAYAGQEVDVLLL